MLELYRHKRMGCYYRAQGLAAGVADYLVWCQVEHERRVAGFKPKRGRPPAIQADGCSDEQNANACLGLAYPSGNVTADPEGVVRILREPIARLLAAQQRAHPNRAFT